nr:MAG TPA: hypothetical protein [Bacteriophage sp.]
MRKLAGIDIVITNQLRDNELCFRLCFYSKRFIY